MDIKKLQTVVIDALEDIKAQDIKLFDTTHLTSMYERIVIVSGTSNRQTKALAASVRDKVKEAGGQVIGIEGEETGEWVLVDLGDMVVHIMQVPIRAYYRLEEIWGDKEIKLGAAKRLVKKADLDAEPKKTSRHLASLKTTVEEIVVTEPDAPVRKSRAKAAADDKPAGAKKTTSRKKAEAEAVLETVAPKKPRARKAAASEEVAAEVVAEAPAKKPRARKTAEAAVPTGKTVKVAQTKVVAAELKEIKEAKTRARKAVEAPAPRVLKRNKPAAE